MTAFFARWPSGRWVKFRSLSMAEYRRFEPRLQDQSRLGIVYHDIYEAVFLAGSDPKHATAGMVDYVGRILTAQNPFNGRFEDVARALDMKRWEFEHDYMQAAKSVIAAIFHYSFEEIDKWDAEMFFERLAQAEYISGRKLNPGDPDAKAKKQARHKKPLTQAQMNTYDRVQARDRLLMPQASEENVYDPTVDSPPPVQKRPLTNAQQMVINRAQRTPRPNGSPR